MEDQDTGSPSIAIVGDQPEALFLAVLFAESKVPSYLVGPFEPVTERFGFRNGWDEARFLLGIHRKQQKIVQTGDLKDLPLASVKDVILVGHATNQQDSTSLERAVRVVARDLPKNSNFVFAGLCRPGYTSTTVSDLLEKHSGLTPGKSLGLCHVPLLWNGETLQTFREKPRIVAGIGSDAVSHVQETFLTVFPSISTTSKISAAEAAGLFAPVYRDVVGALEVELASLCQNEGVDYTDALHLCKGTGLQHLGFPRMFPARDAIASAIALSVARRTGGPRLIRAARHVKERAPQNIVEMVKRALARCGRRVRHSRIAILGLDGLRGLTELKHRPFEVIQTLRRRGATISLYPGENFSWPAEGLFWENVRIEKTVTKAIEKAHCALIALEGPVNSELNVQRLASEMSRPAAICDLTRVMEASNVERAGLFYTSIGRGWPEA